MKVLAIAARILLGATFIYSGFVKGIDPWGSTYKFIDYFTAFNMLWMQPAAFALAVFQNALEFVIGAALVLGLRMKETGWAVLLFMGFYTVLTLILALTNPVSDCGCFGDALILTNWQTFYKNLVLMALAVIVFGYRKKYLPAYSPVGEWIWITMITLMMVWISMHCYRHLPWIDFRPYRIGADIRQGMTVPEGMPADEYYSTVILEKDGVAREFPVNNYPWDDSAWIYRDTKTVLVKKGYTPPIHDFSITTADGSDITDEVLADEGYVFLLVAYRLNRSNRQALDKASDIADFCKEYGYRFYCLTASPQSEIEPLKSELGLKYDFCFTDEITLKTIIRANPGLVLLQKGTIADKWHHNDMPDGASLKPNLLSCSLERQAAKSNNRLNNGLLAAFIFFAFVFFHFRHPE
ncbi:MAG: DoxX family protein [Bacteroidales bacterium]|jgi:uncharacterized membrane protein YphA (DoxX/SURF4 family)|nr:DoxX family protein [Bacteroidales bacterium]